MKTNRIACPHYVQYVDSSERRNLILRVAPQAALTAIASISLFDTDIRGEVSGNLKLIPYIQVCLFHRHVGVRYAACQCVRALSRAVAVLRTNLVDSGLGLSVYQVFCREDEDARVTHAAASVICNIISDFSPLQSVRRLHVLFNHR